MTPQAIVETFVERLWNQRQLDLADDLFPADFVAEPIAYQPLWQGTGPDSMKHHIQAWVAGVPDLQMRIVALIAQGQQVWAQWEITGTHQGVLYGLPPSGLAIIALGMTRFGIEHNQIRTLKTLFDGLGLMQQLTVLPDAGTLIRNHLNSTAS